MGVSDTFLQKVWKQASNLPKLAAVCYSFGATSTVKLTSTKHVSS